MKTTFHHVSIVLALLGGVYQSGAQQSTAFTYQGRLNDGANPATGNYDFRFRLASDPLGNNYVGAPVLTNGVPVATGLFTVTLDFGPAFTGSNYWLEVDVRTNGATGYSVLAPLQALTPAPYALYAMTPAGPPGPAGAPGVAGVSPFSLAGTNAYYLAGSVGIGTSNPATALEINGTVSATNFSGSGAALTSLNPANLISGTAAINISGTAATSTTAASANNFTGNLAGDVTGTQGATAVRNVGGQTAASVAAAVSTANSATSANSPGALIMRDGSGNFSAGTISASLAGNAATATTAANFSGGVSDGQLSANIPRLDGTNTFATRIIATNGANSFAGTISGDGGGLTNLNGASIANGSISTGSLADGGVTSAKIADGTIVNADIANAAAIADSKLATITTAGKVANTATTATSVNTPSAIVARDASGNFSAGAVAATSFIGNGGGLTNLNASNITSGTLLDAQLPGDLALLDASQTFSAPLNTFGDIALQNGSSAYHHLVLSGGNSLGYLYGSYAAFGDGIHLGYNYFADSSGTPQVPNTGGGTSRISAGYGYVGLYVGGIDAPPSSGMTIYGGDVTVTATGIGFNSSDPQAPIDLGPSGNWCGGTIIYRNGINLWNVGIDCTSDFGFAPNTGGSDVSYIDTSGNYHQISDLQLKRDITNLDNALDRVLKLRPVSYHFRSAPTNAPFSLGFLAQEVQPVFPEVVGEQTNGVKDLVYSELIPVAIRSIQELNEKVEAKDARIQEQAGEIADLKARLERLEQLLLRQEGGEKRRGL